jgi:hypothetical protein
MEQLLRSARAGSKVGIISGEYNYQLFSAKAICMVGTLMGYDVTCFGLKIGKSAIDLHFAGRIQPFIPAPAAVNTQKMPLIPKN